MWVFLAAALGTCALVVIWAIGEPADVGGLVALAVLGIGILVQMADSRSAGSDS